MARAINRLSALEVKNLKTPGYYADGGNLYFRIAPGGAKGWIFRFALHGRTRDAGLGPYPTVTLAKAREAAEECRRLVADGRDPIEERKAQRAAERVEAAKAVTFDDCVKAYIAAHEAAWRNAKHRQQWTNTLMTYVSPVFGRLPVKSVDSGLVLKAVEPLWTSKKVETASRVRGRIEAILDWAKVRGYRDGENPARWRGHLEHELPAKSKVRKVVHHPALPYAAIGDFMADLRQRTGVAARALEFTILCAVRTGDIIGNNRDDKPPLRWSHVDGKKRVWTIPSTKTDTEHRVPLSTAAVAVLARMEAGNKDEPVFPGSRVGEALSNMSMAAVIERMNDDRTARGLPRHVDPKQGNRDVTVHGFRSTFRDWTAERTMFPREIVEMALAHTVGDETERAYQRSDVLDKRRKLMDAWAAYCAKPETSAKVVPIRA